ncbi:glucosyl transferase [Alcanivorax sp. HI0033]|uniref:glycosyltransferase family 4 protein n=1 Tax=unclassified Alcanivorax TaxID=2638842 RepID=UPI0007BA9DE5|nr:MULTISPECIES: glycosyltransferase family 4 protein [unclassified Alcanivorax]KZX75780.1 glucosyl transferase [Alcanivorax sp. HI0013]KZX79296.1 glucosyl transferase [Alcanivorax sp. HI0011]KZY17734.1 glucosyl transferase [Alcanivorax sp. HI0035]KZX61469.1 glucosyl transferase [Alcanivorax sp. HI0003]KZX66080.1 glucosyl transferase [Alcanivorax sp. HI0007]
MKLAMALYHYFPYGGLQRDFARIAREAVSRGHEVVALVSDWQGETIDGVTVQRIHVSGGSNHGRMRSFARGVLAARATGGFDRVVGFNRLPGLDVYFAADSCFAEHLSSKPTPVRWLPRYASYLKLEQAVTAANGPLILFLNDDQRDQYLRHYPLAANRYAVLPPGIERDRQRPADHEALRQQTRESLSVDEQETLLLFLGSGFKVKGLDRALKAFATLPETAKLMIVGNDQADAYLSGLAESLRCRILVLGPRDDVTALMQAADMLLHPAYRESAGMVLLEATVAGLPVLTTDTCGYARYVREAGSGEIVLSPFSQQALDDTLQKMVRQLPGPWQENGVEYGRNPALYCLAQTVMDQVENWTP